MGTSVIPPPLVYNVPVRAIKVGSSVEALTSMFRRVFHITKGLIHVRIGNKRI